MTIIVTFSFSFSVVDPTSCQRISLLITLSVLDCLGYKLLVSRRDLNFMMFSSNVFFAEFVLGSLKASPLRKPFPNLSLGCLENEDL